MEYAQRTAGLCIVRDAADIVPFLCGHHLRIGLELLQFVDDGSTDGTFEFLDALSEQTPRVRVHRTTSPTFRQPELMTEAANALIGGGFQFIVPFDSDEFWDIEKTELERICSLPIELTVVGKWVNFVQQRDVAASTPSAITCVAHRAPVLADASRELIKAFRRSFVCSSDRKVAFKTDREVKIARGQHFLLSEPKATYARELEILHLPFRSEAEIAKRALNYEPRRAPLRSNVSDSWQSAFHRDVVLSGRGSALWRANSAGPDGYLDVEGERIPLVPDDRLRQLMLHAAAYMGRAGFIRSEANSVANRRYAAGP